MKVQAVCFDLFETLMTEWGHEKYLKSEMCADLGVDRALFDLYWEEKEQARYLGEISFEDSLRYVCEQCGRPVDDETVTRMTQWRIRTKSQCFEHVQPAVYELLNRLKAANLPLAIVSNCSAEEVVGMEESRLYPFFDQIILSYEAGLQKPDVRIYQEAARRLGVNPEACVFVGDGGSHELEGARQAGMTAIQAKWYTNQHLWKRESLPGFATAEEPTEILRHIQSVT